MLPQIASSLIFYTSIIFIFFYSLEKTSIQFIGSTLVYFSISIFYATKYKNSSPKHGFFGISIMMLSIPLVLMMLKSIENRLTNMLPRRIDMKSIKTITPQHVSGHVRDGINVNSYTRNVTQTTTDAVVNNSVGAGNITITAAKKLSETIDK